MKTTDQRPNILVIMTDQHRWDYIGRTGRSPIPTPNIDRIAARGVRFDNAFCAYPVCVASRMAMLTGLSAHTTGAVNNSDHLDWRYRTLAHHFADQGYLTGLIGKMHFGDAHKHGFEYYLSINDWLMYLGPKVQHFANEIASNPHNKAGFFRTVFDDGAGFPDVYDLWDGKGSPWAGRVTQSDFKVMASELEPDDHLDMFVARESIKFLRRYKNQPFVLFSSFMKPHTPLFAPRAWAEKYPVDSIKLPDVGDISGYPAHIQARIRHTVGMGEHLRRANQSGYLACLDFADHCIGRLYDAMEAENLIDNTIVVYTSDHGDMGMEHGLQGKFCLYDPSVKVPMIISYPRHLPQDAVSNALVDQLGLYPTLADLSGTLPLEAPVNRPIASAPQQVEGCNWAGRVRNPSADGPDAVFSEYDLRGAIPQYMVRTQQHKYIHNDGSTHELYDLRTDPGEYHNRIDDPAFAATAADLRQQLFAWFNPASNRFRPAKPR